MQLLNGSGLKAGYTLGAGPDAREHLVVVVKGTFGLRHGSVAPHPVEEQADLVEADVFTGEPGLSAPLYETDYAFRKPRCDVLLHGSGYAPNGIPAERVRVGMRVGSMQKVFDVVGDRTWREVLATVSSTTPIPFTRMPVSYDGAFGGVDRSMRDPADHRTYLPNPAGKGYWHNLDTHVYHGQPLPNTEESHDPVRAPNGTYRPMAFGPIGRGWSPRPQFAGTFDQHWIDEVFPFLPADFDERYYQSAPPDQQTDYLRGGEPVTLYNLTPEGRVDFRVPVVRVPVLFLLRNGEEITVEAVNDTLVIEPDNHRFMRVWRASHPLRRDIFEVSMVVVGTMPPGWHRARRLGKAYYRSLQALIVDRRAARGEDVS
jgi:hypothetical protein